MTTKATQLASGIELATSGGTSTNLTFFEEHSYTATWNYGTDTVNTTIHLRRIGNTVFMQPGTVFTNSSIAANYQLQAGSALPIRFRPPAEIKTAVLIDELGNVNTPGSLFVAGGILSIYKDSSGNNFTASAGVRGLSGASVGRESGFIMYRI